MEIPVLVRIRLVNPGRANGTGLRCLRWNGEADLVATTSGTLLAIVLDSRGLVHVGSHDQCLLLVILPNIVRVVLTAGAFRRLSLL